MKAPSEEIILAYSKSTICDFLLAAIVVTLCIEVLDLAYYLPFA